MAQLIVKLRGEILQNLELETDREYLAGRAEDCAIQLSAEKGISRQHFKIKFKENQWTVELISKMGEMFQGTESKKQIVLNSDSSFSTPPYEFAFIDSLTQNGIALHERPDENNLPLVSSNNIGESDSAVIAQPESEVEKTLTVAHSSHFRGVLVFLDDNGDPTDSRELDQDITFVGRENENHITLDNPKVSRKQFKISRVGDKYFLLDLESINGTYLNGNKVSTKDPVVLISGDIISVLNIKISFELRDPNFSLKVIQAENQMPIEPQAPLQNMPMHTNEMAPPYIAPHQVQQMDSYLQIPQPALMGQSTFAEISQEKILNFWGFKIELNSQNKFRLILVGIIFIGLIGFLAMDDKPAEVVPNPALNKPADPFTKLTPEEQNYVRHTYSLAKNLYMEANYRMAQSELMKVHDKVPKFEDSRDLENYIKLAIEAQKQQEENLRIEKEKKDIEERMQNILKHCTQLINKNMTLAELNECLAPAVEINPEHPAIIGLREQIIKMDEERKLKAQEKLLYETQVKELKDQYLKATKLSDAEPLKGITALDEVMKSTLPDPEKLKEKARKQKFDIENDTKKKVSEAISKSTTLVEGGAYKEAIITLEKARLLSPDDEQIPQTIEQTMSELRKKMQVFYQEAVVEENIGNVETAKEKWKKILEIDVPNGEYYQKSRLKLKKYGAI